MILLAPIPMLVLGLSIVLYWQLRSPARQRDLLLSGTVVILILWDIQRNHDREMTALAFNADEADITAKNLGDALGDCETEPGPSVFACLRTVNLLEGFKNFVLIFFRNADAGVFHLQL